MRVLFLFRHCLWYIKLFILCETQFMSYVRLEVLNYSRTSETSFAELYPILPASLLTYTISRMKHNIIIFFLFSDTLVNFRDLHYFILNCNGK